MVASLTTHEAAVLRALDRDGPLAPADLRAIADLGGAVGEVLAVLRAQGLASSLHGRDERGDATAWTRITPAGRAALQAAHVRVPSDDLGVIRRWSNGKWLFMNRRDRGFAEHAYEFSSLEELLAVWSVRVTDVCQDEHGLYLATAREER